MGRRSRKPPVKPEVRKKWLRRYEEDGESPPQIAAADSFDVRTVRKQIELARQEREVRETRSTVLRSAVENHYRDLCKSAEELDTEIKQGRIIPAHLKNSRMLSALREHMPRSPLWKKLGRWDSALEEITNLEDDIRAQLKEEVESDSRLSEIMAAGDNAGIPGILAALYSQSKSWARGWKGLDIKVYFKVEPVGEGFVDISYGNSNMNKVKEEHAAIIREVIIDFESRITGWDLYRTMQKLFTELEGLKLSLRDELAIITLRRIVPGRCKYCPI